jgi:nitrogen-specific signal transduction histidine kinase
MKVLLALAEDRALCESLRAVLSQTDVLLFEERVEDALRRLVALRVDAVVLDDAPGLGESAIAPIRTVAPNVHLIALSSYGDLLSQAALTRAGADVVIPKPFSPEALRKAVHSTPVPNAPVLRNPQVPLAEVHRSPALNQHQMALRWIGRASLYMDDPVRLSQSLVESAADIFDAVRCAVLLEYEGTVRVVASLGIPNTIARDVRLTYAHGLMRWFDEHACLIHRSAASEDPEIDKEMALLNAQIAAPLLRNGRIFGAILLGEKASGSGYTAEECELLTLVARCTSVAFERAQALSESFHKYHRLDAVLGHLPYGIVVVTPSRHVALINRYAEECLHIRASEVIGKSVQKLGSIFADVALRALQERRPLQNIEVDDVATRRRYRFHAMPMGGEGVVVSFEPLPTPMVSAEETTYSPFWQYLSARVAQEIKNPMVAINTFAQLLPRKYDSPDFRDAFSRVVQQEVERINRVVETLFEFSRNPQPNRSPHSLQTTIEDVLRAFDKELRERQVTLDLKLDPEVTEADIDPVFFSQALHNLVQNSLDAMPNGGRLTIETKKDGEHMLVRISDSGPGISAEDRSKIFMPFFSTKEKGMGLGLTIAQRIVESHGGRVELEPSEEGACFTITLPRAENTQGSVFSH